MNPRTERSRLRAHVGVEAALESQSPNGDSMPKRASRATAPARARVRAVERLALSPDEAAAAIGVSRDYLDEHVSHELRWIRRGRRKFVAVKELERWLDAAAERVIA